MSRPPRKITRNIVRELKAMLRLYPGSMQLQIIPPPDTYSTHTSRARVLRAALDYANAQLANTPNAMRKIAEEWGVSTQSVLNALDKAEMAERAITTTERTL